MLNWFDVEKGIIPLPGTHSDAFDYSSIDKYRLVLYRFMGWYNILKSPIKFAAEMSQTFWCDFVRNLQKPYREEILSTIASCEFKNCSHFWIHRAQLYLRDWRIFDCPFIDFDPHNLDDDDRELNWTLLSTFKMSFSLVYTQSYPLYILCIDNCCGTFVWLFLFNLTGLHIDGNRSNPK